MVTKDVFRFTHFLLLLLVVQQSFAFTSQYPSHYDSLITSDFGSLVPIDYPIKEESVTSRRSFLFMVGVVPVVALWNTQQLIASADDDEQTGVLATRKQQKILVLGGSGFVGTNVVKELEKMGITAIVTSRNGRDGTIAFDVTKDDIDATIRKLSNDVCAIISCIGSIGSTNDETINAASGIIAKAAKSVGVNQFVYIGVAPNVKDFATDIDFFNGYMKGKQFSEALIRSTFGASNSVLIQPTFIYGGNSFGINPPRVATSYGQFIEAILSSSPIRLVEGILPPGFIKVALEPPISVDDVAKAAVAAALGKSESVLDTYDKIKNAAAIM